MGFALADEPARDVFHMATVTFEIRFLSLMVLASTLIVCFALIVLP